MDLLTCDGRIHAEASDMRRITLSPTGLLVVAHIGPSNKRRRPPIYEWSQ